MNSYPLNPYPLDEDSPRSGLLHLRNATEAYFQANDVPATVALVGLKYRSFTMNQRSDSNANRVVFIPGVFDGNLAPKPRAYGTLSRNTQNSSYVVNPREILAWERPFTLSIWAAPQPGNTEGEDQAVALAEDLLEQTVRAITYAPDAYGVSLAASVIWGSVTIASPPVEGGFGVEFLVQATQNGPLFDKTLEVTRALPAIRR